MAVKLKLLIVDNSLKQRNSIKRALDKLNVFELIEVKNSSSALELLKLNTVDIIITGINIGKIDGWRFSRMIRSGLLKTPKNTPILLNTPTHFERIAATTARTYGIDTVLTEQQMPQLPQILANVLSSHLEKSSRLNLLLIEPDKNQANEIGLFLQETFKITHVLDNTAGMAFFRQNDYAIVLCNAMTNMSPTTHELVAMILEQNPNQAIVTMIESTDPDIAEQLLLSGVSDFIRAPYTQPLLNKICDQAARREDFMVSYAEFAKKVEQFSQSQQRYKKLFSAHQRILHHLNTVVVELDAHGVIQFINPAWESLTGFGLKESLGKSLNDFFEISYQPTLEQNILSILSGQYQKKNIELQIKHKNGNGIWIACRLQSIDDQKIGVGITASIDNIHERKQVELQLQHLALHDTLTGLHNRYYFDMRLNQICQSAKTGEHHALIYIDLDHFKVINDSLGHQQGDNVIKKVAKLFQHHITRGQIVCRIGGDEFAVILQNTDLLAAHSVAENLCQAIERYQFHSIDRKYSISCSIGLTTITTSNNDASECLKQSDIALYVAKNRGRNLVHCYSKEDDDSNKMMSGLAWTHEIRLALQQDKIELHFQPIWDLKQDKITYFETLLRIRINDALIYPNQFIPPLELTSDINLLDHCVVKKAIESAAKYKELNKIAINLSAHAFADDTLLPMVKSTLKKHHVAPDRIVFEITESASISNLEATKMMIQKLNELGCSFSIDDFGTGFSTFSYLKQLPADQVKIDGSFVKDMLNDPIDLALVKAIKDISHSLGKTCVAEFVEDYETFKLLKEIGVDYAQGYHISKPISADLLAENLKNITPYKT